MRQNVKRATFDEVLELMATGFLRGGSGFLKSGGEMLKVGGSVNREVRVGVTQVCSTYLSMNSVHTTRENLWKTYEVTVYTERFLIFSDSFQNIYQMNELHLNSKLHAYMEKYIVNDV